MSRSCRFREVSQVGIGLQGRPIVLGRRRPTNVEALDLVYAEFLHEGNLLFCLHTFYEYPVAPISNERDDVLKHPLALRKGAVVKERAIDLHGVELDQA